MAPYSDNVVANLDFLGDRAREMVDQEMDRARSLDTKAAAIIAASVALGAAGTALVTRLAELDAGADAKTLWAVELIAALVAALLAGGLAVRSIAPRVSRSSVHFREMKTWETPRVLEADPVFNQGKLLRAAVHSVGLSRDVNRLKAKRLKRSSLALALALASVVLLTVSVAVHDASYSAARGSHSHIQCQVQTTRSPSRNTPRLRPTHPTWTIRCSPFLSSTSSSARGSKPRKHNRKTEAARRPGP
jgi:hypothetical protein